MDLKQSRAKGFAVIFFIYIIAFFCGLLAIRLVPRWPFYLRILFADVVATAFVFTAGVILQNASVYDPYWSVQPPVILVGVALYFKRLDFGVLLLLLVVFYWAVRLTVNWAMTFRNLRTQDWRYSMLKEKFPRAFQLVSFLGINLFPTLVVYLALLPAIAYIAFGTTINALTGFGCLVCLAAATLQLVADVQMHRFRKQNSGKKALIRTGVWKHARHPNYLGEILMWWGVFVVMFSALPQYWYLGTGAFLNTLMFTFISIPMADNRNRREREGFEQYMEETRALLPIAK